MSHQHKVCWSLSCRCPLTKPSFQNCVQTAPHSAHTAESVAAPCLVWFLFLDLTFLKQREHSQYFGTSHHLLRNSMSPIQINLSRACFSGKVTAKSQSQWEHTFFWWQWKSSQTTYWAAALKMSRVKARLFTWKVIERIIVMLKPRKQKPGLRLLHWKLQASFLLIPGTSEQILGTGIIWFL